MLATVGYTILGVVLVIVGMAVLYVSFLAGALLAEFLFDRVPYGAFIFMGLVILFIGAVVGDTIRQTLS